MYVLRMPVIQNGAVISVLRTIIGMLATVLCVSHMAYLFSKREMPMHKPLYRFVIVTMYFGAGLIPYYLTIRLLGLFNTFWVYIVPGLVPVYYMVLIKTYIESIPISLEESAMIDGAGYYKRFFRIIIPLCKPILATIALFCMVSQWNSFMDTLLYITDYKLYTLQYILYQMIHNTASIQSLAESGEYIDKAEMLSSTTIMLTVTIIITLPIICVYPFVQKYFVKGIMIGAVKG
jgi:ABC-type glycerol-3-phosphate transport system permease component